MPEEELGGVEWAGACPPWDVGVGHMAGWGVVLAQTELCVGGALSGAHVLQTEERPGSEASCLRLRGLRSDHPGRGSRVNSESSVVIVIVGRLQLLGAPHRSSWPSMSWGSGPAPQRAPRQACCFPVAHAAADQLCGPHVPMG